MMNFLEKPWHAMCHMLVAIYLYSCLPHNRSYFHRNLVIWKLTSWKTKGNGIAHPAPIPMARKLLGFMIYSRVKGFGKNVLFCWVCG